MQTFLKYREVKVLNKQTIMIYFKLLVGSNTITASDCGHWNYCYELKSSWRLFKEKPGFRSQLTVLMQKEVLNSL